MFQFWSYQNSWKKIRMRCANFLLAFLGILFPLNNFLSPTFAWYDTFTTPDDVYTYGERTQGKEHVPQYGTHVIEHRRTDEDWLKLSRSFKVFQTRNKTAKKALISHFLDKPVIGQISPRSGPAKGGTQVRVWGTMGMGKGSTNVDLAIVLSGHFSNRKSNNPLLLASHLLL